MSRGSGRRPPPRDEEDGRTVVARVVCGECGDRLVGYVTRWPDTFRFSRCDEPRYDERRGRRADGRPLPRFRGAQERWELNGRPAGPLAVWCGRHGELTVDRGDVAANARRGDAGQHQGKVPTVAAIHESQAAHR